MNWEAIAALSQVIGLIVVVASLIYIAVQTRQAKEHAAAASEIAFVEGVTNVFNGWATDERTSTVIRDGFRSFNELRKDDQALFQARVGALVNQLVLADSLLARGLLSREIRDEVKKITLAVLSTDGGLEYWEHDSKAGPGGVQLLEEVKRVRGTQPRLPEVLPWWNSDSAHAA